MKKNLILAVILLLLVSCELIKDATEIDFQSDFQLGLQVNLEENDNAINEVQVIEMDENDDIEKYKDNLEDVVVDSILISIVTFTGPANEIINASLKYSEADKTAGTTFAVLNNLNISDMYSNGKTYKVNYDENEIVNASAIMLNDQKIKIYLEGTASETPVDFNMLIKLYTTIVAQPID